MFTMPPTRRSRGSNPQVNHGDPESDNPANWTVTQLKLKLSQLGIHINVPLSHSVLKRIYLDNVQGARRSVNHLPSDNAAPDVAEQERLSSRPSDFSSASTSSALSSPPVSAVNISGSGNTSPGTVNPESPIPSSRVLPESSLPPSSSSLTETVLVNTLQLCQQALASIQQQQQQHKSDTGYSLQTAMTGDANGMAASNVSTIDLVSPEIRADILAGKDINLNILLIPNYTTPSQRKVKENDERVIRQLSLDEFIVAFDRYKKIMCSTYPNRSAESCSHY